MSDIGHYEKRNDSKLIWCNSHRRKATHLWVKDGFPRSPHCDPNLGGILLPCFTVDLTGMVEIEQVHDTTIEKK